MRMYEAKRFPVQFRLTDRFKLKTIVIDLVVDPYVSRAGVHVPISIAVQTRVCAGHEHRTS